MVKDEASGQILAVELRREWLAGCITPRRTYYTTPLSFDRAHKVNENAPDIVPEDKIHQGEILRRRPRDPHLVHPGDDSSTMSVTLTKCPVRSYHPACQTLIDLVNDSGSFDPNDQRLRIRGGTRSPRSPAELVERSSAPAAATAKKEQDHDMLLREIDNLYKSETSIFWPPEPDTANAAAALADLYKVLNPPGYSGNIQGSWDERSMVYATGGSAGGLQALVFVSWDPSIYLTGTTPYPGGALLGRAASSCRAEDRDKGRSKGTAGTNPTRQAGGPIPRSGKRGSSAKQHGGNKTADSVPWMTVEPAMYREIAQGYHFAS